jgi:hypothetical protein
VFSINQQGRLPSGSVGRVRRAALKLTFVLSTLAAPRLARADCDATPCVDAEPMWLTPAASRFTLISETHAPAFGKVASAATFGFRWRPAVISVPSPNRTGRDVNALLHATDLTLGARAGIGRGVEVTAVVPAGLYQRGAGIKGVTHQSAPAVPEQSLHDPRLGFGFALPVPWRALSAKLRLELKLPLGDRDALAGEAGAVTTPSLALAARTGGWFAGLELGARLRQPAVLFGARVGAQALVALGVGYELSKPRLGFAVEGYALPSLVRASTSSQVPAEWLATARFAPQFAPQLSFGLGGGTGLPLSSDSAGSFFGFGVPLLRLLAFARWTPGAP